MTQRTPVKLDPAAPRFRVKHSTTEPLRPHRICREANKGQVLN